MVSAYQLIRRTPLAKCTRGDLAAILHDFLQAEFQFFQNIEGEPTYYPRVRAFEQMLGKLEGAGEDPLEMDRREVLRVRAVSRSAMDRESGICFAHALLIATCRSLGPFVERGLPPVMVRGHEGREYWLVADRRHAFAAYLGGIAATNGSATKLGRAARHLMHTVALVPCDQMGVHTVCDRVPVEIQRRLADIPPERLKVALSPLHGECGRKWRVRDGGDGPSRFYLHAVDEDRLSGALLSAIRVCRDERVALLVLPELTLSANLEALLSNELAQGAMAGNFWPILVFAGSRHRPPLGDELKIDASQPANLANVCTVFDYRGNPVELASGVSWSHAKLQHFQMPRSEAIRMGADLSTVRGTSDDDFLVEPMVVGKEVRLVDTPIGRICVLICLDCLSADAMSWAVHLASSWFVVPAMSGRTDDFSQFSRQMGIGSGSAVLIVNACLGRTNPSAVFRTHVRLPFDGARALQMECSGACIDGRPCLQVVPIVEMAKGQKKT